MRAGQFHTYMALEDLQSLTETDLRLIKHSPQKLGQESGITSIPEVERSIDSSTSIVYRPLALSNQPLKNSLQIG